MTSAVSRPKSMEICADHPQLLGGQRAAVDADPEHEVLVVELVRLEGGGLAAVDAGLALGVEAVPAEPAAQVARVDGGEAALGVDVLDPGPDVERVVVLLGLLVGVQRLAVAERPLALALLARRPGAGAGGAGTPGADGVVPAGSGGLGHRCPQSGCRSRLRGTQRRAGSRGGASRSQRRVMTHHRLRPTEVDEAARRQPGWPHTGSPDAGQARRRRKSESMRTG